MTLLRFPLLVIVGLFAIVLAGCNPRAVESLIVDAPESLETNKGGDFSAMANEDARPPVVYSWEFGDGQTADGTEVSHAFSEAGNYTVIVTATNRDGKYSVSDTASVMVMNPPVPAQVLALLANPSSADTQNPVEFSANVRGDAPLSYSWTFGDGTTSSSPRPRHTYMSTGEHAVSLQLSNEHGRDARTMNTSVTTFEPAYCADLAEMTTVFFERNSSVLSNEAMMNLGDNLGILNDCLNINVRVEGMSSPFERNPQDLSEDRARALMEYYISNGIDSARITMIGLGSASGTSKKSGASQFRRADSIPLQ